MENLDPTTRATGRICSFSRANRSFALSLTKNEQIAQKTNERIPNPAEPITVRAKVAAKHNILLILQNTKERKYFDSQNFAKYVIDFRKISKKCREIFSRKS